MSKPILTKCYEQGVTCDCCGEDVNVHRCEKCFQSFDDDENIYCSYSSTFDSKHWHEDCYGGEE